MFNILTFRLPTISIRHFGLCEQLSVFIEYQQISTCITDAFKTNN